MSYAIGQGETPPLRDQVMGGEIQGPCRVMLIDPTGTLDRCRRLDKHKGKHASFGRKIEAKAIEIIRKAPNGKKALEQIESVASKAACALE